MIDFHSHILPGMDDGSQCVRDSLEMLRRLRKQRVDIVALTPHFCADHASVEQFLQKRQAAFDCLHKALPDDAPQLLLGAEVLYSPGISHLERLSELCLEGTNILLLEMPFSRWNEHEIREVCEMAASGEVTVLLAHIERYLAFQSRKVWERLLECGVMMQSNAEFFLTPVLRRCAIRMLRQDRICVLGTDTHNLSTRAPRMDAAMAYMEKRMGTGYCESLERRAYDFLKDRSHG